MARAPEAPVLDAAGQASAKLELEENIFGVDVKPHLVHEAVRAELNERRRGTRGTKSRGLVSGGRGKPWRQKGTGRARAGSIRAPQFTGGGVAFPPGARDFDVKVNRKAFKAALRSALTRHARDGTLAVVDGNGFDEPSTRKALALLSEWGNALPLLVVATADEGTVTKSFRNIERVAVVEPGELEVAAVVWARSLLVTEAALPTVRARAA